MRIEKCWTGKVIRVNTSHVIGEVRIISPRVGVFTVHSHTSSVLSSVGHGLVDPKARGFESVES